MQYAILTIIAVVLVYSLAPLGQGLQKAFEQINHNISIIQEVKK